MNLPVLFDSIILNAQGARSCYFAGREDEAFVKLEQCQRTIAALREFRDKVHALLNADPTPPPAAAALRAEKPPARRGRPPGSGAKPKPPKAAPTPPAQPSPAPPPPAKRPLQRLPSAEYPPDLGPHASLPISPYHTANDVSDDGDTADLGHPSPAGATELVPDFIARLDEVFFGFLARVCSDLNATDSEGERIHQTQTAKRLQGVSESDFNAFKFRIRPFINAFREELQSKGFTPDVLPEKLLKLYLAQQRYISRFNEEGRKAKSKGTHVWMVEAKKTADGGFIFREFERKIVGPEPPAVAHVGSRFRYEPRIFDPQTSSPKVTFKSPNLPDWLRWESNVLTGIVPPDAMPVDIQVLGHYRSGDDVVTVEKSFHLDIAPWDASSVPPGMFPDGSMPYSPTGTLDSRTFALPPTPADTIPTISVDLAQPKTKMPRRNSIGAQPPMPVGYDGSLGFDTMEEIPGSLKRKRGRPPMHGEAEFANSIYQDIAHTHGAFNGNPHFGEHEGFSDEGDLGQNPDLLYAANGYPGSMYDDSFRYPPPHARMPQFQQSAYPAFEDY